MALKKYKNYIRKKQIYQDSLVPLYRFSKYVRFYGNLKLKIKTIF
jgi:hypothetical protein